MMKFDLVLSIKECLKTNLYQLKVIASKTSFFWIDKTYRNKGRSSIIEEMYKKALITFPCLFFGIIEPVQHSCR